MIGDDVRLEDSDYVLKEQKKKMMQRVMNKRCLWHLSKNSFSGGDIREKFSHEITEEGYDYQRQFHVKPPTEEKLFQLTNILSSVPIFKTNTFLNFLATNLESTATVSASDYIAPPRVHENGIFVYEARALASTVRKFRSLEAIVLPGALVSFTYPVFAAMVAVPTYFFLFNAKFYEMSRRLVVRMDILPHLEMVSVQRVGAFGVLYSKLYRIQDLEYVPFEAIKDNENYLWAIGGHGVDNKLVFKDKVSGEFFYFDRTGIWDAKGLDHALLN